MTTMERDNALRVKDIHGDKSLTFVSDSQDVQALKDHFGECAKEFDSFFVETRDGDYTRVYGMYGTVPYTYKTLTRIG